jgi:ferredoxin
MTRIRFLSADGARMHEIDAPPGERLLDLAQADGQPLEGTCEGQMACSTCHVIVDAADFKKLPPASEEEEYMLDLAFHVAPTSRLACQVWTSETLDSLTVRMPGGAHDMQGR